MTQEVIDNKESGHVRNAVMSELGKTRIDIGGTCILFGWDAAFAVIATLALGQPAGMALSISFAIFLFGLGMRR